MIGNLPEDHPFFPTLQKTMNSNTPSALSGSNLPIQVNSSRILYDMLHCALERKYKQLYIKSKLCELLALELDAYQQRTHLATPGKQSRIKPAEIERMHQAKEIILANMRSPCSLIDLAHQVGTNEAYLKKHFKEVFGMTVFGYLHEFKMKEAADLLTAGRSVSEVSHLTGYTHVSHFTRAFKKHYGINPKVFRHW
jgi:AraC-like DNA-binding protein